MFNLSRFQDKTFFQHGIGSHGNFSYNLAENFCPLVNDKMEALARTGILGNIASRAMAPFVGSIGSSIITGLRAWSFIEAGINFTGYNIFGKNYLQLQNITNLSRENIPVLLFGNCYRLIVDRFYFKYVIGIAAIFSTRVYA